MAPVLTFIIMKNKAPEQVLKLPPKTSRSASEPHPKRRECKDRLMGSGTGPSICSPPKDVRMWSCSKDSAGGRAAAVKQSEGKIRPALGGQCLPHPAPQSKSSNRVDYEMFSCQLFPSFHSNPTS